MRREREGGEERESVAWVEGAVAVERKSALSLSLSPEDFGGIGVRATCDCGMRARGLGVRAREEVGKFRQALLGVPSPQQQQQELVPVRGREEAEQLN